MLSLQNPWDKSFSSWRLYGNVAEKLFKHGTPRPVNSFVSSSLALQCRACAAISIFLCFDEVQSEAACRAYCNAKGYSWTERNNNWNSHRKTTSCVGVFVLGWENYRETVRLKFSSFSLSFVFCDFFELCCFVLSFFLERKEWYFFVYCQWLSNNDSDMCPLEKKWEIWVQTW